MQTLLDDIRDNRSLKEMITNIKELSVKNNIPDHEIVGLIWSTVMGLGEWNKKEELVADQALKHLKQYTQLFIAFATTDRAELALILKVQEFCYENMNFMKAFQKIILLFYKGEHFALDFYSYFAHSCVMHFTLIRFDIHRRCGFLQIARVKLRNTILRHVQPMNGLL